MERLQDVNIRETVALTAPRVLKAQRVVSMKAAEGIIESRHAVQRILDGRDDRIIAIVGPCSIHDRAAALEYAERLKRLSDSVQDRLLVVMRVYFEKPRTTVGWKGLINDPHLNDTFDIGLGLSMARNLLVDIAELGLPVATEMLEPITPQYIADLVTLASIGARTTESPTHRQMASGLSMPVGFKNGTDGSLEVAINAMKAALSPHSFLGIDVDGNTCIVHTNGNRWGHLILRGGRSGPNYQAEKLQDAVAALETADLPTRLIVDCSHANSEKDHRRQAGVWNDVTNQRIDGNHAIIGLMLESNLRPGRQDLGSDPTQLEFGVSITDACIGWDETEALLRETHERLEATVTSSAH